MMGSRLWATRSVVAYSVMVCGVVALLPVGICSADPVSGPAPVDRAPLPPIGWAWPRVLDQLTRAVVEGDVKTVHGIIDDHATIHIFNHKQSIEIEPFMQTLRGQGIVGVHAYVHPPLALAADLAADFKAANNVPAEVKDGMIPRDDQSMRRANATAAQWAQGTLDASTGDPVGVIVLFPAPASTQPTSMPTGPASGPSTRDSRLPIFLLIKGKEIAPDHFKVTSIVFGRVNDEKGN